MGHAGDTLITVVSGRLGSGKSYDCTRLILNHLRRGGAVRSNMTLRLDACQRYVGRKIYAYQFGRISAATDPKSIPTGDRRGSGKRRTFVVLDEALNWFDSGTSTDKSLRTDWGEWLRQSDKLGQDVFFIAQNFDRAAKWIRELAQLNREMVPLRTIRIWSIIPIGLLIPYGSRFYVVRVYDVRSRQLHSSELHCYTSDVWSCYDTAETYGFVGAASAYDGHNIPQFRFPGYPIFAILFSAACLIMIYMRCAYLGC